MLNVGIWAPGEAEIRRMGRAGVGVGDLGEEPGANWRGHGQDLVWRGSEEAAVLQPARTGITT